MKRYQVHIAKKIVAELIVEAESENLARAGVKEIAGDKLKWSDYEPHRIEHIDEIDGDPDTQTH